MRVKQNEEEMEEIGKNTIKMIRLWDESTGKLGVPFSEDL